MPIFAARVSEVPRLLDALWHHPQGMRITDLAAEVDRPVGQVREALLAYYTADFASYAPDLVARPDTIEFFGGSDDTDGIRTAPMVRLVAAEPGRELGVAYATAAELIRLSRAARGRLALEPDNEVLASAVRKLHQGLMGSFEFTRSETWPSLPEFHAAIQNRRLVRIVYARAWKPGVVEGVIEPYRLIRTRRSWEIDAGPVGTDGGIRTYLLTGVQQHEVLIDSFQPPANLDSLLSEHRRLTRVELVVPHEERWVADKYSERVQVLHENETNVTLALQLLPPLRLRTGLILLAGGPEARIVRPVELADSGRELARILLAHYSHDSTDRG